MKPRAAVIIQSIDGSITWTTFDAVHEMSLGHHDQEIVGQDLPGGVGFVPSSASTFSIRGRRGVSGRIPPGWVADVAALPAPAPAPAAAAPPADMVTVSRELLIEAADSIAAMRHGPSDEIDDDDVDLANRLRAAAGRA